MLEGLEVSEIRLSGLYDTIRIDAETYRPFYLEIENAVKKNKYHLLDEITSSVKKGIFDINSDCYAETGVPFVRITNLKNMGIDTNNIVHIPEKENQKNLDTYLQKGDVILSKTAYAAASIVNIDFCNTSQDTVAIKLKKDAPIQSSFLVAFLNSKYGYAQMQRWFTGNIQMHLNLTDCKGIFIPELSKGFQNCLDAVFWKSFEQKKQSNAIYNQAEQLLLQAITLKGFSPSAKNVNLKLLGKSYLQNGRLDAEYYLPKYEDYQTLIKSNKGGFKHLVDVCDIKDDNYEPLAKANYNYIELSNIGSTGDITGYTSEIGDKLPSRARRMVHEGDIIVPSVEGSLQSCALVTAEYDNALCSTGFYIVKSTEINSETLLVLFKSQPMQNLFKQACTGTILTAMNKGEFENILVPIIDSKIQKQISALILRSFELKKQGLELLKNAKEAVEVAIEEGEQKAIKIIK